MSRRRPIDDDSDDVHRAMLEHLARNPPPRRPAARAKPVRKRTEPAPKIPAPPAEIPRLMLRKMRVDPALDRLASFVRTHHHRRTPKVVVVVGKGRGSGIEGPVLGPAVRAWCDRNPSLVRDLYVAPPSLGGDGALVLQLAVD